MQAVGFWRDEYDSLGLVRSGAIHGILAEAAEVECAVLGRGQTLREDPSVGKGDFSTVRGVKADHDGSEQNACNFQRLHSVFLRGAYFFPRQDSCLLYTSDAADERSSVDL